MADDLLSGQIRRRRSAFGGLRVVLDISEIKEIEKELRQAKDEAIAANRAKHEQLEELELLYRMTPVGLSLIDKGYRVLRINDRLAATCGKPCP